MQDKVEIIKKLNRHVLLARVLTKFDLPFMKYPKFGTWSYLIRTGKGIVILDAGPKYDFLSYIIPYRRKPTQNSERILNAVENLFPGEKIQEILLSHYHFDHSEEAPRLQQLIKEKNGYEVPIRFSKRESGKKFLFGFIKTSIQKVFRIAGYTDYILGPYLVDGEKIGDSGFTIKFTPGHTSGDISLIDDKNKLAITGYYATKNGFIVDFTNDLIHEDKKNLKKTRAFFRGKKYTFLFHHPRLYH